MLGKKVYYDLVEIEWHDGKKGYIPVPMFMKSDAGIVWLSNLPISDRKRDNVFFNCLSCGRKSFFETCMDCKDKKIVDTLKKRKDFLVSRILDGKPQPADVVRAVYIETRKRYYSTPPEGSGDKADASHGTSTETGEKHTEDYANTTLTNNTEIKKSDEETAGVDSGQPKNSQ
ncbi:MAG: hypothetical protein QW728_07385 [Thermoplasmata archaeon]